MRHGMATSQRWRVCAVALAMFAGICTRASDSLAQGGTWSRNVRPGGETWIYRFTVPNGVAPPSNAAGASLSLSGEEAPRVKPLAVPGGTAAAPSESDGSAAAAVDLVAQRAYLKTAAGGQGTELPTPIVGQTAFFYLDFSIIGAGDPITADRQATLDGQPFCGFTGTSPPGDYYAWCNDGWTATAGQHTLEWDLDSNNAVAETNENNNSASTTWTSAPAGSVDLEAQRAYLRTMAGGNGDEVATPSVGQTIFFYLDFDIVGPGSAITADRLATLDGQPYCGFTGTSPPGAYFAWCNDGWVATAGTHTLQWMLDPTNQVAETNESNNAASALWTSGGACTGDCSGDGEVTVNELITMVDIALGTTPVSTCSAGDANGDGEVTVNEIVAGVNHALSGCG